MYFCHRFELCRKYSGSLTKQSPNQSQQAVSAPAVVCLLACLFTCLLARLLIYLHTYFLVRLLAYLLACVLACLLACMFAYLLACLRARMSACLLTCLRACMFACFTPGNSAAPPQSCPRQISPWRPSCDQDLSSLPLLFLARWFQVAFSSASCGCPEDCGSC